MGRVSKFIEINTIRFNNFSNEAKLSGIVFQDNLSFESVVKMESNLINLLINYLQRNNPDTDIVSRMETECLPDDEMHYTIALDGLNRKIPMDEIFTSERYVQIRA